MLSSCARRGVATASRLSSTSTYTRTLTSAAYITSKKEGDISDAFASLSRQEASALPDRYRQLKLDLSRGHESALVSSWRRLLAQLRRENERIASQGSAIIPQVDFGTIDDDIERVREEMKLRGAVVVRGVIPEAEARGYKTEVEEYIKKNPHTRAFPQLNPQVYELYWSAPQLKARGHPNLLKVQQTLMTSLWHTSVPSSEISLSHPLCYADRLRIRQPGDATFALGPHMDGGSVERWEREGYGKGGVYDPIFAGRWENYDPWDASGRVEAVSNLFDGLGACSMFRMWQGWLSMSRSGPHQGTLLVNPLMRLTVVYTLLRAFFAPLKSREELGQDRFLDADNWRLLEGEEMNSDLHGATPGRGQEFTDELHPHLELAKTMVHIPAIKPGDFVAWHCDTIHSVDKVHAGSSDSSVLYIPVCPVTSLNAEYLVQQREAFLAGTPGPDFPGGAGEAQHVGRPGRDLLTAWTGEEGATAMGLNRIPISGRDRDGAKNVVEKANEILGF